SPKATGIRSAWTLLALAADAPPGGGRAAGGACDAARVAPVPEQADSARRPPERRRASRIGERLFMRGCRDTNHAASVPHARSPESTVPARAPSGPLADMSRAARLGCHLVTVMGQLTSA